MTLEIESTKLAQAIGADMKYLYSRTDVGLEMKQQLPLATWVLQHNLNKYPSVTVVNSAGEEVIGKITHDSKNKVTIEFSSPFSGTVYFN